MAAIGKCPRCMRAMDDHSNWLEALQLVCPPRAGGLVTGPRGPIALPGIKPPPDPSDMDPGSEAAPS